MQGILLLLSGERKRENETDSGSEGEGTGERGRQESGDEVDWEEKRALQRYVIYMVCLSCTYGVFAKLYYTNVLALWFF